MKAAKIWFMNARARRFLESDSHQGKTDTGILGLA